MSKPQMFFVKLPVSDVQRARKFYTGLGFTINEHHGFEDPDGHIWELAYMQGQPTN